MTKRELKVAKRELKVALATASIKAYEAWKCARTWDAVVSAVAECAGISRKAAGDKLSAKYGKMFAGSI